MGLKASLQSPSLLQQWETHATRRKLETLVAAKSKPATAAALMALSQYWAQRGDTKRAERYAREAQKAS